MTPSLSKESKQQQRPADDVPHPGAPDSEVLLEVKKVTDLHLPDKDLFTPSKLVLLSQAPRLCSLTFLGFVVYLPMSSSMTKQLSRVTWHHHKVDSIIHGASAPACHFGTLSTSASGFIVRNLRSFRGQPSLDVSLFKLWFPLGPLDGASKKKTCPLF
ncbi:hypothetical protein GOODEAATRI_000233 [Goodea atripinnis]|uniref:Uncharacterized protein n=1 Tax=Goodea atripinnis TaxID=208336 RepID=A0ABV0N7N1_9TELE